MRTRAEVVTCDFHSYFPNPLKAEFKPSEDLQFAEFNVGREMMNKLVLSSQDKNSSTYLFTDYDYFDHLFASTSGVGSENFRTNNYLTVRSNSKEIEVVISYGAEAMVVKKLKDCKVE